jgi:hypothetical protein
MQARGFEPEPDFARALALEPQRIAANWGPTYHYRTMGLYAAQLEPYLSQFAAEQVLVLEFEEFRRDTLEHMRRVYDFLGVDPSFAPRTSAQVHLGGRPRSRLLSRVMNRPNPLKSMIRPVLPRRLRLRLRRWNLARQPLDRAIRAELYELFRDDIRRTEDLLGRDLSGWHQL